MTLMDAPNAKTERRRDALTVLVEGTVAELTHGLDKVGALPAFEDMRRPESGLVMVRGRVGGDGAPFNLGEAAVSRSAVRLATGEIGFGYVLGRDTERSRLIAVCDALLQRDDYRAQVEREVLGPIRVRCLEEAATRAARTAATRVDFFTLVRGED